MRFKHDIPSADAGYGNGYSPTKRGSRYFGNTQALERIGAKHRTSVCRSVRTGLAANPLAQPPILRPSGNLSMTPENRGRKSLSSRQREQRLRPLTSRLMFSWFIQPRGRQPVACCRRGRGHKRRSNLRDNADAGRERLRRSRHWQGPRHERRRQIPCQQP